LNGIRVFLALVALSVAAPQVLAATPSEFVAEAVDVLATKLDGQRKELADDPVALYALIDEVLLPRFDRKTAAQQVLARHWRAASPEQRARFIEALYAVLVQRYAIALLDFEPGQMKVLPFRGEVKKRVVVKTTVKLEDGTNVSVDYALLDQKPGWKMYDVSIEGVSYVRNLRAEINAEVGASSLEQVIVRYEEEAAESIGEEAEVSGDESEKAETVGDNSE
jgi:phospholipid transport system substrate-binding protein